MTEKFTQRGLLYCNWWRPGPKLPICKWWSCQKNNFGRMVGLCGLANGPERCPTHGRQETEKEP
jgi:hypothetical protein